MALAVVSTCCAQCGLIWMFCDLPSVVNVQVDLVAVDSVAALLPRAELEGTIGDHTVSWGFGSFRYGQL
jgi:hypothetical protein